MNIRKMSMAAALLAGLAGAAQAAELTLFQHPNFGGNQLTLRGHAPNISNYGFNDQTSSLVVRSGRWVVCTDAEFKGHCAEFVPGDYPRLDAKFNDRISSAREVGAYGNRTGNYRDWGTGAIKFFSDAGFGGRSHDMQRDHPDFREFGFNDRAASVVVTRGTWELCTDINYSGNCRLYGPGHYQDLGPGMAGRISSGRVVRPTSEAPAEMRGGWRAAPRSAEGASRVILFADEGLRGPSLAVSDTLVNLQTARFNDAAASMIVEGGTWLACSDAYFAGHCRVFAPGRYEHLRDAGLTRVISSLRPASPEPVGRRWDNSGAIQLFTMNGFGGETRQYAGDVPNLVASGFNDRANSMVVHGGEWELCSDAGYAGSCMVVGPGSYADLGGLSSHLSSMRRVR
ncbi:beta/gamma crystallin-related protein [Piscinibacter sp. XHJ-5]|uniref:beta/gamma crystallin-related protein n=1 Tax=Piscinibacter sp. XHJ-5 TaxID=3037797 RepID=UPI0024536230|nr:beta/gamma crystallin-related protein [Piscinibacter sp. XHJ-5]